MFLEMMSHTVKSALSDHVGAKRVVFEQRWSLNRGWNEWYKELLGRDLHSSLWIEVGVWIQVVTREGFLNSPEDTCRNNVHLESTLFTFILQEELDVRGCRTPRMALLWCHQQKTLVPMPSTTVGKGSTSLGLNSESVWSLAGLTRHLGA
jgi:hypothetical protein